MSWLQAENMEAKFKKFGFNVIDWQMDDASVGIFDGWIIYTKSPEQFAQMFEINWCEGIYAETKEEVQKTSVVYVDE